ncbi:MAG: ATP-dependent nuclease [Pyrinomonadaceae bacterium]
MFSPATITSVEFRNFKALEHFSIKLQHMNVLVGPNNCGKSTVIGAFRALVAGLRRARVRSPEHVLGPGGNTHFGYNVSIEALPISIENVHTDYAETDTSVTFRLSNGNKLRLYFPADGGCVLIAENEGKLIRTPRAFREAYPITIGITPVLGPVEHNEILLTEETVRRDLATHRASRQFRNFWHYNPEEFEDFAELVKKTWTGMEIRAPELNSQLGKLSMFCLEKRIPRELYWSGFGFQIWCQLLTHIARSGDEALFIVDEPEVYLHPDVQRQLLGILRDAGPDIILATHSTEIMGEADPAEILLIDKSKRAAERLKDVEGVQAALKLVGSVQNITLTMLARNRRVLFVEGLDDFKILRRFARRLGLTELSIGVDLTPVESGGFSSWERIRALTWGIEKTLGRSLHIGAIFDRDYWCSEEVTKILGELKQHLDFAHIHERKEIENYLLMPEVLERTFRKLLEEKERRTGEKLETSENIDDVLERITERFRARIQAQYIAKRVKFFEHSKLDRAVVTAEAIELFESRWLNLHSRMEIVPGKETLHSLREALQANYGISFTNYRIIEEFRREEIPNDLQNLLRHLDEYRRVETQLASASA